MDDRVARDVLTFLVVGTLRISERFEWHPTAIIAEYESKRRVFLIRDFRERVATMVWTLKSR